MPPPRESLESAYLIQRAAEVCSEARRVREETRWRLAELHRILADIAAGRRRELTAGWSPGTLPGDSPRVMTARRTSQCQRRHVPHRPSRLSVMATNLFVGNLSPDVTNAELRRLFGRFGTVLRVRVATDRGFGYVEMRDGAGEATRALNGAPLHGYPLMVWQATAPGGRGRRV